MKILVVEDRSLIAQDLIDRLERFSHSDIIGPFASGEDAEEACENTPPDIALLDITLKGSMTGIQLAEILNSTRLVPVVYLTQHEDEFILSRLDKATTAYFLNKPFSNNELKMALASAERMLASSSSSVWSNDQNVEILNDRIFIRNGRGKVCVMMEDILWIQSGGGDTSSIMTSHHINKDPKSLPVVGLNLSKLEDKFSFSPHLVRCSRFHIVNLKKVNRIIDTGKLKTRKALIVEEETISVGDKYRKNVMNTFRIM